MIAILLQLLLNLSPAIEVNHSDFYTKIVDQQTGQLFGRKPAFVKFYAPQCGHCQAMAAAWSELAETYYDNQVDFFEIDCTADDNDSFCVEDF